MFCFKWGYCICKVRYMISISSASPPPHLTLDKLIHIFSTLQCITYFFWKVNLYVKILDTQLQSCTCLGMCHIFFLLSLSFLSSSENLLPSIWELFLLLCEATIWDYQKLLEYECFLSCSLLLLAAYIPTVWNWDLFSVELSFIFHSQV